MGGHDGSWEGQRHFKCPKGHGLYLPLSKIMKDPMFLPDKVPIDLNDLTSATGISPALHRSVSDNATSTTTTKRRSSENVSAEKILDKFLELTATAPGESTDGMFERLNYYILCSGASQPQCTKNVPLKFLLQHILWKLCQNTQLEKVECLFAIIYEHKNDPLHGM